VELFLPEGNLASTAFQLIARGPPSLWQLTPLKPIDLDLNHNYNVLSEKHLD
jgi:hypothetical protein